MGEVADGCFEEAEILVNKNLCLLQWRRLTKTRSWIRFLAISRAIIPLDREEQIARRNRDVKAAAKDYPNVPACFIEHAWWLVETKSKEELEAMLVAEEKGAKHWRGRHGD